MFVTNWISTTKIQKISEITNFFRHYFLSRTEVSYYCIYCKITTKLKNTVWQMFQNICMITHNKEKDKKIKR